LPAAAKTTLGASDALLNKQLWRLTEANPLFHPDVIEPSIQRGLVGYLAEGILAKLGAYPEAAEFIPYRNYRYSPNVYNQPNDKLCVPTCGAQLLADNEGINYAIEAISNQLPKPNVGRLGLVLNKILGNNRYVSSRVRSPDDPALVLDELLAKGDSWVAGFKKYPDSPSGHAVIVRGKTWNDLISIVNPWGPEPGSGLGTIGTMTKQDFLRLWSNNDYVYTAHR
jgi:hypothetical protein